MNNASMTGQWFGASKSSVCLLVAVLATSLLSGPLGSSSPRASAGGIVPNPMGDMGSGWIPDVYVAGSGDDHNPAITTAFNGDLLLVYEEGFVRDIYFTRSTNGGLTWSPAVAVAASLTDESQPDITTDAYSDRIFVSYLFGTNEIRVKYSDDGLTWLGGGPMSFVCTLQCDRPRIASEYLNSPTNRQYVVTASTGSPNDWDVLVLVSTDQGVSWNWQSTLGWASTDVRSQPEIAVQRGWDGTDRVFVTYRLGATYPGDAGCIDWSEDYGASFLGPACNMFGVASPIVIAASHDGTTNLRAFGSTSPADGVVWVVDDIDPSTFTSWDLWTGMGYYPALTVDGVGQTGVGTGGYYHMTAQDTPNTHVIYGNAPVDMTSNSDWSPVVRASDSTSDTSDSFNSRSVTTQWLSGIWYPVLAYTDYRYTQWDIRVTTRGSLWTFDTVPPGLSVIVDGVVWSTPATLAFPAGTLHAVDVVSPQPGMPGLRFAWSSWSDAGAKAHTITAGTADTTLIATFDTEYEIAFDTTPTSLNVTFDGITDLAPTTYWALAGIHTVSAPSPQAGPARTRYVFASWTDAGAMTHDITVAAPMALAATFGTEFEVAIDSTPTGRGVTFNGITGTTPASFWIAQGTYTVSTTSPQPGATGWRYTYSSWSDAGAISHSVDVSGPTDLSVTFTSSVLLSVISAQGNVVGDGWYNSGATADLNATAIVAGGTGTRYIFESWSGDATGTNPDAQVLMDAPKTVTANWATEYFLSVATPHGTATGSSWYRTGRIAWANVSAAETSDNGKTWQFTGWTGDATGTVASITITMDGPKNITATWREKPGIFGTGSTDLIVFSLLIVVIVVVVLLLLLMMRRKKRMQQQQQPASPMPPPPPPPPPTQQGAPPQQWPQQQAPQQWPPQQPPQRGAP